jgi:hypothetical protein
VIPRKIFLHSSPDLNLKSSHGFFLISMAITPYNPSDRELRSALSPSLPTARRNVPDGTPVPKHPVAELATQWPAAQCVTESERSLPEKPEVDNRIIARNERDRWTPGGRDYGQPVTFRDTSRCVTLHASTTLLHLTDLLPEEDNLHYEAFHEHNSRDNHAQVQGKNSDEEKKTHDSDDKEHARKSSRDEGVINHGLDWQACHWHNILALGHVIHLYICRNRIRIRTANLVEKTNSPHHVTVPTSQSLSER